MATRIYTTVSDVCQIIADLRGESNNNTDTSRIRAVSRANQDIAKRRFWRFYLLVDQSLGTGDDTTVNFTVGSATFPFRPNGLQDLFVGGTTEDKRVTIVSNDEFKTRITNDASDNIAYTWYDATNDAWKVKLNVAPASGEAVTASYYWEPPVLTATSDAVVFPNATAIARLAAAEIYEGEDEDAKRNDNLQLAENLIADAEGVDTAAPVGQIQMMGAIANALGARGYGSY